MILLRMLKNDLRRRTGVLLVVFSFVFLSSLLLSGGAGLIVDLGTAIEGLFSAAKTPDLVQMHAGAVSPTSISEWARENPDIKEHQISEMLNVDASALRIAGGESEAQSVMDISFVVQNPSFDFLVDLDNRIARLEPGEVGLPLYFAERRGARVGDTLTIEGDGVRKDLTIATLVRDSQMNPAIVHSKRFLIHPEDYEVLSAHFPEKEYLIEFLLSDSERSGVVSAQYLAAGLPQSGPTVDRNLFVTLSALSDGIAAAVVIALSGLLICIAILCLRFTILSSIEEDYREIGVMKAVGMSRRDIRRMYLLKYLGVTAPAIALGYLASLPLRAYLASDILLYMGTPTSGLAAHAVPGGAAVAVFLVVTLACFIVLRRFDRISAVGALQAQAKNEAPPRATFMPVRKAGAMDLNVFLGVRDVVQRFRLFGVLILIYFFAAFITTVPLHFLSTVTSPSFVSYMGIGRSDLRVDIRDSVEAPQRFSEMLEELRADPDVALFSPLVTSRFVLVQESGEEESIAVESGDFSLFPLDYISGAAPRQPNEIALSYLNAKEMEKALGEPLTIRAGDREERYTITGIYQDVTNGGRTAKARIPWEQGDVLQYAVSIDLAPGVSVAEKAREFETLFAPARVTDLEGYLAQTLGNTINRLRTVTLTAILVGTAVSVLITSLFLRMLISRDARRIAIMQSIGFTSGAVRRQYLAVSLLLLGLGIATGTIFANTAGEKLVSALWSLMGAARIDFVIDPLLSYLLLPLLLAGAVGAATLSAVRGIHQYTLAAITTE